MGCPTLAAPLFLRLGWDSTNLHPPLSIEHMKMGCPTLAAPLFLRLGWDSTNLDSPSRSSTKMGAPGLDFQTWDSTNLHPPLSIEHMKIGCPTLAAPLFLRLGWDSTNLDSPSRSSTKMGAPGLDFQTWDSTNLHPPLSIEHMKMGCPTLAAPLFLRLGWGKHNPGSVSEKPTSDPDPFIYVKPLPLRPISATDEKTGVVSQEFFSQVCRLFPPTLYTCLS